MPARHWHPILAALVTAVALASAGCGDGNPFKPLDLTPPTEPAPPAADTPQGVVERFQWAWEHRNIAVYKDLFTDDFLEPGDHPIGRQEEIDIARRLFESAQSIELTLVDVPLVPLPDTRPNKPDPQHKLIQTRATIRTELPDSLVVQDVDFNFFVVRGDSAQVPEELVDRYGPQEAHSTRHWYIERLEHKTADGVRSVPMTVASVYTAPRRSHPSSLEPSARRPGRER